MDAPADDEVDVERPWLARVGPANDAGIRPTRPLFEAGHPVNLPPGFEPGDIVRLVRRADGEIDADRIAEGGTTRAALFAILERHRIDPTFPADVLAEVAHWQAAPGIDDASLDDWTALPFVTIDNPGSRDLDQALYIERVDGMPDAPEARFAVHYALADASHYVRPGSALFAESLRRGTSYYLPGMAVPMLPRALSEDLVSLSPHVDRRAFVFSMALDTEGVPVDIAIRRARIHSHGKLTYHQVQRLHDDPEVSDLRDHPAAESLRLLRTVGELRIDREIARDVVQFNRVELLIEPDPEIDALTVRARERCDAERWNEQISLLCNALGAQLLREHTENGQLQPIFRTHPAPAATRVREMQSLIGAIVSHHGLDPEHWCWRQGRETLAAYLERLPGAPELSGVRRAIERQILYSNQASTFSPFAEPHHALGLEEYARFSAPMREVVGIFTHKEALELLGLVTPCDPAEDELVREAAVEVANRARQVQRRIEKEAYELVLSRMLDDDCERPPEARRRWRATVMGVRRSRVYVLTGSPPLEIKVYTLDLERQFDAQYQLDEAGIALHPSQDTAPTIAVGDTIAIRVRERDAEGRWRFDVDLHP